MTGLEITFLIILIVILAAAIFVVANLLKKVEFLEQDNLDLANDNSYYVGQVLYLLKIFREIDYLGSFEADDEVGKAFTVMRDLLANVLAKEDPNNPVLNEETDDEETQFKKEIEKELVLDESTRMGNSRI